MKKQLSALALSLILMTGTSTTALAQIQTTPFDDVPTTHWSYNSLKILADDGIVKGFEDDTFRGGNAITRYEMAAIVGKALSNAKKNKEQLSPEGQKQLEKLSKEFYSELTSLGVRLKALEKYKSKPKINGDLRFRYIANPNTLSTDKTENSGGYEYRVRMGYQSEVAKDLNFKARLNIGSSSAETKWNGFDSSSNTESDWSGDANFDMGYLTWYKGKYQVDLGRMDFTLGQGAIAGGIQDGIYVTYRPDEKLSISSGYSTLSTHMNKGNETLTSIGESVPIFQSNIGYSTGATYITLSHLRTLDDNYIDKFYLTPAESGGIQNYFEAPFKLSQFGLGFTTRLSDRWKFTGEYITNQASNLSSQYYHQDGNGSISNRKSIDVDRDGYWLGLSYGNLDMNKANTFQVDLVYMDMGNWAIDSTFYPHGLWVGGGNRLGRDGAKGWGLQAQYMLGKNLDLAMDYFILKPKNNDAGFDEYRAPWQIALNYFF